MIDALLMIDALYISIYLSIALLMMIDALLMIGALSLYLSINVEDDDALLPCSSKGNDVNLAQSLSLSLQL